MVIPCGIFMGERERASERARERERERDRDRDRERDRDRDSSAPVQAIPAPSIKHLVEAQGSAARQLGTACADGRPLLQEEAHT